MSKIADVIKIRDEINKEQDIVGIIRTYNILEPGDYREKNPSWVFEHTFPTTSIRNIIQKINEKLSGIEKRGTFIFTGGYGTGKSHNLVLMYHIFKNPEYAKEWANKWNIEINMPPGFDILLLPLNYEDFRGQDLWKPIFEQLGRKDIISEVEKSQTRSPTIKDLQQAIENRKIVIIIDELEDWYEKLDSKEQKRNKDFLKHLFEVSQNSQYLFIFVAIYGENDDIKEVINRVNPIVENLTYYTDENKNIILFRIFETSTLDKELAEKIVERYIKTYKDAELNILAEEYKKEMLKNYPFHPEVLKTLFERYVTSRNYQNTRGILFLLAPIVSRVYNKLDLVLLSDIDITLENISGTLKILNRKLFESAILDIKDTENITYNKEILSVIFLYSLGEVKNPGATEQDIILNVLRPGLKVADIKKSINELLRNANHLWLSENKYVIKEEERPIVVVEKRAKRISTELAKQEIKRVIQEEILEGLPYTVFIEGVEEIKDDRSIKVVLSLYHPTDEKELDEKIRELYHGIENRNTILFIIPKKGINLLENEDVILKAKRIIASQEVENEVERDKKADIEKFRSKELEELKNIIKNYYGFFIKPLAIKEKLDYRPEHCELSTDWIKDKIDALGNEVEIKAKVSEILKNENKIRMGDLLNRFYQIPGYPIVINRTKFEECLSTLCKEKKLAIIFSSGAKKFGEHVTKIDDSATIMNGDYYLKEEKEIIKEEREIEEEYLKETKEEKPKTMLQTKEMKTSEKIGPKFEDLVETASNIFSLLDKLDRKEISNEDIIEDVEFELRELKYEGVDSLNEFEKLIDSIRLANVKEVTAEIKIKLVGTRSINELKEEIKSLPNIMGINITLKGRIKRK